MARKIRGQFLSGKKWVKTKTVIVKDKKYDSKTSYCWTDPDFPHDDHVNEAIHEAKKAGEKDPLKAWSDYLDWSKADYRFKCNGFLKYNKSVDCLPEAPLGRIPVKELERCRW